MTGNVSLGGFQLDTDGRLVSSAVTTTAVRPTVGSVVNPLVGTGAGAYAVDSKIAVADNWTNSNFAIDPYVYNQISAVTFGQGNVWSVPVWGVGYAVHTGGTGDTKAHAWGVAGIAYGTNNVDVFARGGEFAAVAGAAADPTGNYTDVWGANISAVGGRTGAFPTGYLYFSSEGVSGAAPQQGIILYDSNQNPLKSTASVMATWYTAFGGGTPHLSCANGINFLNTTFSGYAFCYGTGATPLFSVDGTGNIAGAKLSIAKATASIDMTSTTGTNRTFISMANTGGGYLNGLESSIGGNLFPSSLAYAAVSGTTGGTAYQIATNNVIRATITNAGDMGIGTAAPAVKLDVDGVVKTKSYTVATLPTGVVGGRAYASNGRKVGEGAGAGTGVPVYYSNGAWRVYSNDATVAA